MTSSSLIAVGVGRSASESNTSHTNSSIDSRACALTALQLVQSQARRHNFTVLNYTGL
jgi:hypothetical protein